MKLFLIFIFTAVLSFAQDVPFYPRGAQQDQDIGAVNQNFRDLATKGKDVLGGEDVPGDNCIDNPTFCVDATNNRVGIGLSSPTVALDIYGNVNIGGTTNINGILNANASLISTFTSINGTLTVISSATVTSTITANAFTLSCPSGFTSIVANSRQLGCMQTAEEGSDTWENAVNDCFTTYGGRLALGGEMYVAMNNFTLTDETDDVEWLIEFGDGADGHAAFGPAITTHGSTSDGTSQAYRCWIPK